MKRELYMVELLRLSRELDAQLSGSYIDQFYQTGQDRFRVKVNAKKRRSNLNMHLPYYIALSDTAEVSDEASPFSMAMRKRIDGFRISAVGLLGGDRILQIGIEKAEARLHMIIELFGKGNIILTDDQMRILLAYKQREFSERTIKNRAAYAPPKSASMSVWNRAALSMAVDEAYESGEDGLASHVARRAGIGTAYVMDAIERTGLGPKTKMRDVPREKMVELYERMLDTINTAKGDAPAILYLRDGKPLDFSLRPMMRYEGAESKACATINEAICAFYSSFDPSAGLGEKNAEVERITASMRKQQEAVLALEAEAAQARKAGDWISARADLINHAIGIARDKSSEAKAISAAVGLEVMAIDRKRRTIKVNATG